MPLSSGPPVATSIGASTRSPTSLRAGVVVGGLGLVTVLAGTFLPWLVSGGVLRNSYAIVGIVGRLGLAGQGFGATALSAWPLLGPVAMLAFVAGIIRQWRTAAAIALLFGLVTGVIGGAALAIAGKGGAGVAVAYTGPVVTAVGGLSACVGAVMVIIGSRRRKRPPPGRPLADPYLLRTGWPASDPPDQVPVGMEPTAGPARRIAAPPAPGEQDRRPPVRSAPGSPAHQLLRTNIEREHPR